METNEFRRGDKVLFGRGNGEQTLGEVVKVNRAKIKVKQLEARGTMRSYPIGTVWGVPRGMLVRVDAAGQAVPQAPQPKRAEADIMKDIGNAYCGLSPENLSCDGELPLYLVQRRRGQLNRRLNECFRELGRRVSEDEAFGLARSA
jgi:hypothetical protein